MFSIPPPDNFWFFIFKFTISISAGVYLLNSYHKSRLLIINALLFFFLAIRSCTEYYLPQIESFQTANSVARFHSILLLYAGAALWYSIYFYVRPFQRKKYESLINRLFLYCFLFIPILITTYSFLLRRIHYLNPSKIAGYWVFRNYDNFDTNLYLIYTYFIMTPLVAIILMCALYRDKENRIRNTILLTGFIAFGLIIKESNLSDETAQEWTIPNFAHLYLFHAVTISYFVSGYRLFNDDIRSQTADLLNSISDIAISTDKHLNIIYINTIGKNRLGDVTGHIVTYLAGRAYALEKKIAEQIDIVLKNKGSIILDLFDKNNEQRAFKIKSAMLKRGTEEIGYTFLFTDLTLEQRRTKDLEDMNKTKDQLFTIIAHDLRKPALAFKGIGSKIDYLLKKEDHSQLYRFTRAIDTSSLNLISVLDNLLNWARDQKERPTKIQKTLTHIAPLCDDVIDLFQAMINNRALTIINNIDSHLQYSLDINAFKTIVRNLTDNAIKFSPVGGTITWKSRQDDHFIYCSIKDEGLGMNEEQIKQFHEHLEIRTKDEHKLLSGTGLGLQLVKDLVKAHNGSLSIKSNGHIGSIFTLSFPINS